MESTTTSWLNQWPADLQLAGCEACDAIFLLPPAQAQARCPACGQQTLTPFDAAADRPVYTQPPELVVPFAVRPADLRQTVTNFARRAIFPPDDLTAENLNGRLRPLYLPMWLVDTAVSARWEAEMGFDYEVVSHREKFKDDKWVTERYTKRKVRWEPRLGTLARDYHNISAPALEEQAQLEEWVGRYKLDAGRPFQPNDLDGALVRLPNRPPQDTWPEAQIGCQQRAAAECRRAAGADHIRQYRWSAEFQNQQWTQLLCPLYSSYYTGENGRTYVIFVHGQSGRLVGYRRASMVKARRWALIIGALAGVLLLASLLLLLLGYTVTADLLPWGGAGLTISFGLALAAPAPPLIAWATNRFQQAERVAGGG